ncbi:tetratricopeptide repeat protein [Moorena sp. SIO3I8]|uniref:tetratricopeptide repeat protein n=1 Tax=Moorena sp. SIO3I8 TaxID=2607833 RepID=UPI0025EB1835|nr:tetratricopeptide repeat protein [Moorena sp. SIO3I8]
MRVLSLPKFGTIIPKINKGTYLPISLSPHTLPTTPCSEVPAPKSLLPTPYSLLPTPLQPMLNLIDADEDLPPASPEEQYQDLLRALRRRRGFGLLFVRCSPVEAEKLVKQVKQDLSQKTIEMLRFEEPIDNLYGIVQDIPDRKQINFLFIQGLEYSFYKYEETKRQQGWDSEAIYSYSWKGVPHILNHLNQHRERFRDDFKICFVFLLRPFVLNYFIHRAPDFFDWRSGLFDFPSKSEECQQEDCQHQSLNPEERSKEIIAIQERLEAEHHTPEEQADLLVELGMLLVAAQEYEDAIANFDKALEIKPDDHQAWYSRGVALSILGRLEAGIDSFDQAVKIKPDHHKACYNRGIALLDLGKNEAAIASYDQALKIKHDDHEAWYNRGNALQKLGQNKAAIKSFDKAVKIKHDYHKAWNKRGIALSDLGRKKAAIKSFDKALKIKPDYHLAWYNRGVNLQKLGQNEAAIESYDKALKIKPDYHVAWYNRGVTLLALGRNEAAIKSYDKALKIKPDFYQAWNNRGIALWKLGQNEAAIKSYDKALKIKPDFYQAWNNRGIALPKLGRKEAAIESYDQAVKLKPDHHQA